MIGGRNMNPTRLNQLQFLIRGIGFFGILLFTANAMAQDSTPRNAEEYYKRATVSMTKQDFDKAIEDYTEAIKQNPNFAEAYYGRGIAWYNLRRRVVVKAESFDVRNLEGSREAILSQMRKSYERAMERAIDDLSKAIKLNKNFAEAYADRGAVKEEKGDSKGALSDYNKAIEVNPRLARAYYNRGLLRRRKNEAQQAIADYTKAIEIDPRYSKAYTNRGVAKQAQGDFRGAIADFNQAILLTPDDPYPYANRANSQIELGDNNAAMADYNKALSLDPKMAEAYAGRGLLFLGLGKETEANQDFDQCIRLDSRWQSVLDEKIKEVKRQRGTSHQ
jgi:tetratricopeptide (TPR) repeat protein